MISFKEDNLAHRGGLEALNLGDAVAKAKQQARISRALCRSKALYLFFKLFDEVGHSYFVGVASSVR